MKFSLQGSIQVDLSKASHRWLNDSCVIILESHNDSFWHIFTSSGWIFLQLSLLESSTPSLYCLQAVVLRIFPLVNSQLTYIFLVNFGLWNGRSNILKNILTGTPFSFLHRRVNYYVCPNLMTFNLNQNSYEVLETNSNSWLNLKTCSSSLRNIFSMYGWTMLTRWFKIGKA